MSRLFPITLVTVLLSAGCSGSNTATPTSVADTTTPVATTGALEASPDTSTASQPTGLDVTASATFPAERCELNKAAGKITFLTGFDYAAAASITEVLVAAHKGYYDALCLDVEIAPSFSLANYPLVASGDAQFASGGSFSEVAQYASLNDADLVTVTVAGQIPIGVLMVKPNEAASLAELQGATIGVKGKMLPSVAAMLANEGLVEGIDYQTVLLDGFNPLAHMEVPGVAAVPGWRSNEPGTLERAGVAVDVYDTADAGTPGSFGAIFTSQSFIDAHPTAAHDFVRATLRGLADAVADPTDAANIAVDAINGGGNPNFLSPEGETYRWTTDAKVIAGNSPNGLGVADQARLAAEVAAYDNAGIYGDKGAPTVEGRYNTDLASSVYDADGTLIWPKTDG